ncbi:efflux RND transporter periplasmic adaptor subunit [Herbaspirillum rhizosphaerae]|uniref:Efflux RND transporter periplasmic adaptor subunit n=1 Tax=Herbaspirillum rhizosphaerae TaxID=346179 RepID=A0ABW8Z8V0_9BURK
MTKKQKLTLAAIAVITALLAALILLSGPAKTDPAESHSESGHDHAAEKNAKDEHKDDKNDQHDEKDKHDEKNGHDDHAEENKIAFSDAQLKTAGIVLETAATGRIRNSLQLPGEIRFNQDRTAHVVPKVSGVVESVSANLGQQVKKGQVLAVISSSAVSEQRSELLSAQQRLTLAQSTHAREKKLWEEKISAEQDYLQAAQALKEAEIAVRNAQQKLAAIGVTVSKASSGLNRFEIRAPFDGIVVEKHLALGEAVKEDANVFTISDLSSVWVEMTVAAKELNAVRVGESAIVKATAFDSSANGKIAYVGALLGEQTRTAKAHVVLANPGNAWRPGLFVNVEVLAQEQETDVPLAIAADAVQSMEQKNVVFVRVPGGFNKQEVTLGRNDGKQVEVLKGLKAGDIYAAKGSFVIKAEQGKGSAEHAH